MWKAYPFKDSEVCCQKTYLSFVDSVWEIFGPLLQGVPTVIVPDDAVKDPHLLVESLAANHVSRIVLVPSLLRVLLDSFGDLQKRIPSCRLWVTSGEEIPLELAKRFREAMPQARLVNLYGSSEVSADVTCYEIGDDLQEQRVPIGRPIDNTQVYLLDDFLQPVPVGVHGELYVGGAGLARGYLNRPDLTAERFIPNPFRQGEVLFKTGDLGRYLSGWQHRVSRPQGPSGEDPRVSGGAGGDRVADQGSGSSWQLCGGAARGPTRGPAADGILRTQRWPSRIGIRSAAAFAVEAAGVHGAAALCGAVIDSADAEWEGGSQGVAQAGERMVQRSRAMWRRARRPSGR